MIDSPLKVLLQNTENNTEESFIVSFFSQVFICSNLYLAIKYLTFFWPISSKTESGK